MNHATTIGYKTENAQGSLQFANSIIVSKKMQEKNILIHSASARKNGCVCALANDSWIDREKKSFYISHPYFQDKKLNIGDKVCLDFLNESNPKISIVVIISKSKNYFCPSPTSMIQYFFKSYSEKDSLTLADMV